jgi:3-hydroxybutyryl-CoA dehydrogenase
VKNLNIGVIGAGTMGRGIAEVAAIAGFHTAIFDTDGGVLDSAIDHLDSTTGENIRLIRRADSIQDATERSDVVIEAVTELIAAKADVLQAVVESATDSTTVCSNTSTISIDRLAEHVSFPHNFLGMHFFNPVRRMRLVEIVQGSATSDTAVQTVVNLAHQMDKTPIVVMDSPGFASSRLGVALGNEAMRMVEQGVASIEDIDTAMRLGYNHPMGPLELADLVGLDARLNNSRSMYEALGDEQFRPPEMLLRLVAEGRLGRKTSRGFYLYEDGKKTKMSEGV